MLPDPEPPQYMLVVLDEVTEAQLVFPSNNYGALVDGRNDWLAQGANARIRFADDAAVWDFLQEHVAADAADYLGLAVQS